MALLEPDDTWLALGVAATDQEPEQAPYELVRDSG